MFKGGRGGDEVRELHSLLCACACSLNKNKKISVLGREPRRAPARLLCRSACALDFFIVYCREVRGAPAG